MNYVEVKERKISPISAMHYSKLLFRLGLFLVAALAYLFSLVQNNEEMVEDLDSFPVDNYPLVLVIIWLVFAVEMIFRFFPSQMESMGCQKQFAVNYVPANGGAAEEATGGAAEVAAGGAAGVVAAGGTAEEAAAQTEEQKKKAGKAAWAVAAAWLALNAGIGALYLNRTISWSVLVLLSLAFSVCDMICILFFCPFQTWFMKNKCCVSCRIYNWDYAMMFTPLVFIPSIYTWSIFALALALLIKWEINYHRHPERFCESTNSSLSCAACQEKLCQHKKSLQRFLRQQRH